MARRAIFWAAVATTLHAAPACLPGYYSHPHTNACVQCQPPEQYSDGAGPCRMCPMGEYSVVHGCFKCSQGTFSPNQGSTACQYCPPGTGSGVGQSTCFRCVPHDDPSMSPPYLKQTLSDLASINPNCTHACTACAAGTYNDGGTKKCTACSAGKFSSTVQAASPNTCARCSPGQSTLPTATGATACVQCNATLNMPMPRSASFIAALDTLVCAWGCSAGYLRFNFSEATFAEADYAGYSRAQALAIFHNRNDFCCQPSTVKVGMYMCGTSLPACAPACTRTSDGNSAACAPVPNARFVETDRYKFNRCPDWVCDDRFFLNQTSGVCTAQPVCPGGFTYQRDAATGALHLEPSGAFACIPCSRCIDGSETAEPCNSVNDTVCRLCPATEYAYQASNCTPAIPSGFGPVRIRLTSIPAFQGRPSTYADSRTPVPWSSINFAQGFFLNSYTPCQPIASAELMFAGDDVTCNRLDQSASACALPMCRTQCQPWNGTAGWYKLKTGECGRCVYDATCTAHQYSDMTACGPTTAPLCRPCPAAPLPNSMGWLNPGRTPFAGPYLCDIACRNGFTKGGNYSCVPCPSTPDNSKITTGCNWTCSLGFVHISAACIPCAGVPSECGIGHYLGYAASQQCASCLPCTNQVANAAYTSTGQANGPNTCGVRCAAGTFVSPSYGFDTYSNPVACDRCSAPTCGPGLTYLQPCSYLADSVCAPCSECAAGMRVLAACTAAANTTCVACSASLLPDNAVWVGQGCHEWACVPDFVREPNTSTCLRCKVPRDCANSNSFEDDGGTGCGRCVRCDPDLLLPGQCFNGDGQCGVSYNCDTNMPTAPVMPQTTTPLAPLAAAANAVAAPAYASMATLTLDPAALTHSLVADIAAQTSSACACNATVAAVTQDGVTTFCTPACLAPNRRLLLHQSPLIIDVVLVGTSPEITLLQPPAISGRTVVAWQTYECIPISDQDPDRRRLAVQFRRTGVLHTQPQEQTSWAEVYVTIGIIAVAIAVLVGGGSGAVAVYHYYVIVDDTDRTARPRARVVVRMRPPEGIEAW